ncbi:MAG: hypothetical protein LBC99_03885 [Spirochaetota bacterium]|jgi:hypothetical protein|nr:hypothetical protein [Spirochaetota bacterium]
MAHPKKQQGIPFRIIFTIFVISLLCGMGAACSSEDEIIGSSSSGSVSGDSSLSDGSSISGDSSLSDGGSVSGDSSLSDDSSVSGDSSLSDGGSVSGNSSLSDGGNVSGNSSLSDGSSISGDSSLSDGSSVSGNSSLSDGGSVSGNSSLSDGGSVSGNSSLSDGGSVSASSVSRSSRGVTQLIYNTWADGDLEAGEVQVFRFTATEAVQYIHFNPGALYIVYAQVYDNNGVAVGGESTLAYNSSYTSRMLVVGQVYSIHVRLYNNIYTGDFSIAYTASERRPGEVFPPVAYSSLTVNTWANGNIAAGGAQWYRFTASASLQYFHFKPGTLDRGIAQIYTMEGVAAGSPTDSSSQLLWSLAIGQEYFIRVLPYNGSSVGNFEMAYNASILPPGEVFPPAAYSLLTVNTWANGNIPAGGTQWFRFTAAAATQYIHFKPGTLTQLVYAQVYAADGATVGNQTQLFSGSRYYDLQSLAVGQIYYVRVRPSGGSSSDDFEIAYNASILPPGEVFPPASVTELTADVWTNGNLVAGGEQWFRFTANSDMQYIHFKFGTLTYAMGQVYTSDGNPVNSLSGFSGNSYISRSLTNGQVYYIRVWPFVINASGDYTIAYTASTLPPDEVFPPANVTDLTVNIWENGNIAVGGEQWFRFTANSNTQYFHFKPGTLTQVYIRIYTSGGIAGQNQLNLGTLLYTAQTVNNGQVYYLHVTPYSNGTSGDYKITYNASIIPPGEVFPPANVTDLSGNTWANGNIAAGGVQWFRFTANSSTQYFHFKPGTLAGMYVYVYTNDGTLVSSLSSFSGNSYITQSLTIGQVYYIRAWPFGSDYYFGTYQIGFTSSTLPPGETVPPASYTSLTADTWGSGNIAAGGVQWFRFTANSGTQYIHFKPGTLNNVYVQVYANDGTTTGSQSSMSSGTQRVSRSLTSGQVYYIRVWPYSGSGDFTIAFNASTLWPGEFPPANYTSLTTDTWGSGNIAAGGVQWFRFTANSGTQYIHFKPGTLNSVYVQVYANDGTTAGSQSSLSSSTQYVSRSLASGQVYYIRVWPSSGSGDFTIAFNASTLWPGEFPPANYTSLTTDTWGSGSIAAGGVQWFRFTADSSTQYIHFKPGTLNSVYVQVYASNGTTAGSQSSMSSGTQYVSRSLTSGQVYYIRVWPSSSSGSGTCQIGYTASTLPPGETVPPASYTSLTADTWGSGSIAAGGVQWFRFTANSGTQYIHFKPGTLNDVYVQVYASNGTTAGSQSSMSSGTQRVSRSLTSGQVYYIRVWPYSSSGSGDFTIAFNASTLWPGEFPPASYTSLTADTWGSGSIAAGGVQWFRFTANSNTQYIHFKPGTLTDVYVQVYTSGGTTTGSQSNLYGSTLSASRSLTSGQTYYIRVWPYSSSGSGTCQIAYNASSAPPP